jgi:sterol desaturase/sphingolipid hydroxylase (fatty acid hydroxylase superfamily)
MSATETFLRAAFEPLQYFAFFGALTVIGTLEVVCRTPPRADRRLRWPANFALTAINVAILALLPLSQLAVADVAQGHGVGLLNLAEPPAAIALVAGFLARTLIGYGIHRAMHAIPWLWRVHRVHHTDTAMDISTTVRFHPLEFAISVPLALAGVALFGVPPLAILIYELVDAAMAVATHGRLRLPVGLDRWLGWVIVTPNMHLIHHSAEQRETDSNFGAVLTCWDRLFGTFRTGPATGPAVIGLADDDRDRAHHLGGMLVAPFLSRRG